MDSICSEIDPVIDEITAPFSYSECSIYMGGIIQMKGILYNSEKIKLIGQPQIYSEVALGRMDRHRPALRAYFKALPDGEYYWFEIEGLNVYDEEGDYYGQVVEIIKTGSNDVYVVQDGKKEVLLPMIDSVVKVIDLEQGKLVFKNIEGLIEDTPV